MIISVCHSYLLSSVFLYFSIVFSYRMKEMNWLSLVVITKEYLTFLIVFLVIEYIDHPNW